MKQLDCKERFFFYSSLTSRNKGREGHIGSWAKLLYRVGEEKE